MVWQLDGNLRTSHIPDKFLTSIGVDPETAAEDACKIEHVISSESFSALKKYLADNEKN